MMERMRTRAVWLALGMVLGGGALAFAGGTTTGPEISDAAKEAPETVAELANAGGTQASTEARARGEGAGGGPTIASEHERKRNHGFYVSAAARCENVDDEENDVHFDAPADCDENGKAHGEYVSQVARSQAGKPDRGDE